MAEALNEYCEHKLELAENNSDEKYHVEMKIPST